MEYLIGSVATLVTMFIVRRSMLNGSKDLRAVRPVYNQSRLHSMTYPVIGEPFGFSSLNTQSSKHFLGSGTKIIMYNHNAYWIKDSVVYSADILDGSVEEDSAKRVDIMGMDKVQLDEMIYIIDMLTEGSNNDNGSSGNKKF